MSLHLYEDLLKAKCETEITLAAERVIRKLGFDGFLYALAYLDPTDGKLAYYTLGTYPKEWLDRYLEEDYVSVDPSIPHCQSKITPLIWESRLFDNQRAIQMNEEAKQSGINAGGWSSLKMVQRYAHLSGEHLRAWVEQPTLHLVVSNDQARTGTDG